MFANGKEEELVLLVHLLEKKLEEKTTEVFKIACDSENVGKVC